MPKAETKYEEVKSNWKSWKDSKVGDFVEGVLVKTDIGKNTLKTPPMPQKNYTLIQEDGTSIILGGRVGDTTLVIPGMENIKIGQKVKVVFDHEGKIVPGKNPAKVLKVYEESGKIIHKDIVDNFLGTNMVETEETVEI
jgi:hypothetical protein